MTVQRATWADLGYRMLGPLPASGGGLSAAEVESRVTNLADFEAVAGNWVRRRARRKGSSLPESLKVVAVLDESSLRDQSSLAFLDQGANSEWTKYCDDLPQIRMETSDCVKLIQNVETETSRARAMYFLSSAIALAAPAHVRPLLRDHFLPCIFRLYPKGKVVAIRFDTAVDSGAALLRSLYALALAPLPELKNDSSEGVSTLREWHMLSLPKLLPTLLDCFNYLFYPFVGGTRIMLPNGFGLCLLVLLIIPRDICRVSIQGIGLQSQVPAHRLQMNHSI
jgi:hypothetical protein